MRFSRSLIFILAICLSFLALIETSHAGQFDNGYRAYERKDYATALRLWFPLAGRGMPEAQYFLGYMLYSGEGITQNYEEAAKWYRKAAEQGFAKAQSSLGAMYQNGQGVLLDHTEAAKWYRKAANQGNALGQLGLGFMHFMGHGVPQDHVKAYLWLSLAAEQGFAGPANIRDVIATLMTPAQKTEAQRLVKEWLNKHTK